jgi:hypothetical protein
MKAAWHCGGRDGKVPLLVMASGQYEPPITADRAYRGPMPIPRATEMMSRTAGGALGVNALQTGLRACDDISDQLLARARSRHQ